MLFGNEVGLITPGSESIAISSCIAIRTGVILKDILRVEKRVDGLGIGHGQVVVFQGIDIGLHLSLLLPLLLLLAFVAEDALLLFLDLFLESLVEQLPLLQLICGGKNLLVMPWQCFAQHVNEKDPPRLRHAPVDGL